jgi:hypothetical protein
MANSSVEGSAEPLQSRSAASAADPPLPASDEATPNEDLLDLAFLVPIVRQRLEISSALPDEAILASLVAIAACTSPRERWFAALGSTLGHWLGLKTRDPNVALNQLIALLPGQGASDNSCSNPDRNGARHR